MRATRLLRLRKVQILIGVAALLVGIRAVLPIGIEYYANKTLDELEGYSGHIEDVDLSLLRGAYTIEGVRIVKTGGKVPVPFFSASEIDLSVQWGALLDGAIVSEIDVRRPKLNFVTATEDSSKDDKASRDDKASNGEKAAKGDEKAAREVAKGDGKIAKADDEGNGDETAVESNEKRAKAADDDGKGEKKVAKAADDDGKAEKRAAKGNEKVTRPDEKAAKADDEAKADEKAAKADVKVAKADGRAKGKSDKPNESKQEQIEPASNWTDVVQKLTPIRINRFSIIDGEVHYRDFGTKPKVDVYVQDINAEARNLTNSKGSNGSLVATFDGRARAMHSGKIRFDGKVDPYAKKPTFDASFRLNDLELTQLNPYFRAFADVDVEKGTFSMDAEFAAKNGAFEGYVKPFIDKLDVLRWNQEKDSFFNKVWQGAVELTSELLQDQSKDRTASRVPIKGRFDQPDIGIWPAIGSLLKNAFIEALRRGLEGSVDVQKVAGEESAAVERSEPEEGESKSEGDKQDEKSADGKTEGESKD